MFSAARTVVAFGLLFQFAGLFKLLVVARYFGAGPILDAYYLGMVIPSFLIGLSTAFLQTGFVPAYVEARSRKDGETAERLRSLALTWTVLLLAVISAFLMAGERPIVALLWPNINPEVHSGLVLSFAVMIWIAPLNGLIDAIGLLLNAEGKFTAAAAAPLTNVLVSTLVLISCREKTLEVLIGSLFSGLVAQVGVLLIALGRHHIRLIPRLSLTAKVLTPTLEIGLPVLISSVLSNAIPAFLQVMAARNGPGAVSALGYANRLQQSVVQAIVMSVSIVLLPHFARLIAERRNDELRNTLNRVFAATAVFYFAALAFVAVGGRNTVDVLLLRGRFTAEDGRLVSELWFSLTAGLLGATWGIFLARLFQARQQPWLITILAVVSVVVNVALTFLLMPRLGIVGVAVANAIAYTVVMLLFHICASRSLTRVVTAATWRFIALAFGVNVAACMGAMAWGRVLAGAPREVVFIGQVLIVGVCNIFVIRQRPLAISTRSLLRS